MKVRYIFHPILIFLSFTGRENSVSPRGTPYTGSELNHSALRLRRLNNGDRTEIREEEDNGIELDNIQTTA